MIPRSLNNGLIAFLVTAWAAAVLASLWNLAQGTGKPQSWVGLLLASMAPLIFVAQRGFQPTDRRGFQPITISIVSGLGLAVCMATSWRYGAAAGSVHIGAGASLIGWAAYYRWLRNS